MTTAPTSFDERYRAVETRDARFDGQFVLAVRTTGIDRPSCPARTPKPANVTFYPTSAAAHEAGYRACKRCLPEAAPGSPAWNVRGDVAARAMRLIADGVVDHEGVVGLAGLLGHSPRHLSRVLAAELGACRSPWPVRTGPGPPGYCWSRPSSPSPMSPSLPGSPACASSTTRSARSSASSPPSCVAAAGTPPTPSPRARSTSCSPIAHRSTSRVCSTGSGSARCAASS